MYIHTYINLEELHRTRTHVHIYVRIRTYRETSRGDAWQIGREGLTNFTEYIRPRVPGPPICRYRRRCRLYAAAIDLYRLRPADLPCEVPFRSGAMPPPSSPPSLVPLLNRLSGAVSCTVRRFCAIIPVHAELRRRRHEGFRASDEISEDRLRVRMCSAILRNLFPNEWGAQQCRAVITWDFSRTLYL